MRVVVTLCALAATASAAPVKRSSTEPYTGVTHEYWEDLAVPAQIHVIRLDLTSSDISVFATEEANRGIKTTTFAARKAAHVAINGGSFQVAGYTPRGLAMGAGQLWSNTQDDDHTAVLHIRRGPERTLAAIVMPEAVTVRADLPPDTDGVLSGRLLVRNGGIDVNIDAPDPVSIPGTRAPRTAVGISGDGNRMWLVVVDGWQQPSVGMTARELAQFLQARGAHNAIGLDIGGTSTMMVGPNTLVSRPSDGVERAVANHLVVKHKPETPGQMIGLICKGDVVDCGTDTSLQLLGATVTLDDTRTDTTTATEPRYSFTGITPRLACATARKTGYKSKTSCRQIIIDPPNAITFNSIQLEPGDDPPIDAAMPDAADDEPDAGSGNPGRPDAGTADPGGGGCCNTGGDHPPPGVAVLVVAVAFAGGRRRGTKAQG